MSCSDEIPADAWRFPVLGGGCSLEGTNGREVVVCCRPHGHDGPHRIVSWANPPPLCQFGLEVVV